MKAAARVCLPYLVFFFLAAVSWQRWIEPYVDSGRELMVPLRIAGGEALYRDVRFYHGPLAPYMAAGIDAVFGRGLWARVVFAALISLAHLEALRRLARRFLSAARASLAVSGIVAVAFFLRPGGQLFPFSFDTSLAVAAITWALYVSLASGKGASDLWAGVCLTATLLCRPEMGIAAILALSWRPRTARRLLFLAALPVAVAGVVYGWLSMGTPWTILRREGWLAIVGPPAAFQNVYASYAGLDQPLLRLAELALAAVIVLVTATLLVAAAFLGRAARALPGAAYSISAGALILVGAAAVAARMPSEGLANILALVPPLVRIVPAIAAIAALVRLVGRIRGRPDRDLWNGIPDATLFIAALFGFRLLLAAGYVGPYNAFLLPLPLLVAIASLFAVADRTRDAVGDSLPTLAGGALAIFFAFRISELTAQYRHPAWSPVATRAGTLFLLEPVASTTRLALADLSARLPSGATLVGLPEGGFFDYVLGLRNPLPQEQFFPGHLDSRLEDEVIGALAARPPDAILMCNVLAVGHGSRVLGKDYLVRLDRFVHERYAPAVSFGPGAGVQARIGDPQFFLSVRVPRPTPAAAR